MSSASTVSVLGFLLRVTNRFYSTSLGVVNRSFTLEKSFISTVKHTALKTLFHTLTLLVVRTWTKSSNDAERLDFSINNSRLHVCSF